MIQVKICGITRTSDAIDAVSAGAGAIGLVFAPESPRRVSVARAGEIVAAVRGKISCVGVFRDQAAATVQAIIDRVELDYLQFHGSESPGYCRAFPAGKWYKAFWLRPELHAEAIREYGERCFLLDGLLAAENRGSAGRQDVPAGISWDRAREWAGQGRMILAGGLNPDNVGEVVRRVRPYGVDVSRGVEKEPGIKDTEMISRFVRQVREADMGGAG